MSCYQRRRSDGEVRRWDSDEFREGPLTISFSDLRDSLQRVGDQ
jgi:hypothetical protein